MDLLIKNFPYFMETYFNVPWWEVAICLMIIFLICLYFIRKVCDERSILWNFLFAMVLTIIIIVSLLNRSRNRTRIVILNPYDTLNAIWNGEIHVIRQTFSNVILYIPFGIVLTIILEKQKKAAVYMGILLSVCIEVLQYLFARGYSESMDVICNTLGNLIGISIVCEWKIMFLKILKRRGSKNVKKRNW